MLTLQDVEIRDMKKFVEAMKGTFSGKIQVKRKTIITGFRISCFLYEDTKLNQTT